MSYKPKKSRHLKPLIILIAVTCTMLVIAFHFLSITEKMKAFTNKSASSLSHNSSETSSIVSSEKVTSSEPIESSEPAPSSKAVSSRPTPSSKDTSSKKTTQTSAVPSNTIQNLSSGNNLIIVKPNSNDPLWNLILLNYSHQLEYDLSINKTKFDTQYVDSRAASAYKKMCDAAKANGITLYLRSGYRSIKTQTINYNADLQRNLNMGYSKEEAIKLTEQYYARPKHSEHHTGLAFDIITPEYHSNVYTLSEEFAKTNAYTWLTKHCTEYGFILRYPKDKVDITKINYEPWHYRYVGIDHAKAITKSGLAFEEYIENMQTAFLASMNLEKIPSKNELQASLNMSQEEFNSRFIEFAKNYPKQLLS